MMSSAKISMRLEESLRMFFLFSYDRHAKAKIVERLFILTGCRTSCYVIYYSYITAVRFKIVIQIINIP